MSEKITQMIVIVMSSGLPWTGHGDYTFISEKPSLQTRDVGFERQDRRGSSKQQKDASKLHYGKCRIQYFMEPGHPRN